MERHKKTIFTRHLFIDLAKECGLNAAIFEQLGSGRNTEIVVDNDTLKMLVKLQEQFAQLEEMGDNEYRGFYIELYFIFICQFVFRLKQKITTSLEPFSFCCMKFFLDAFSNILQAVYDYSDNMKLICYYLGFGKHGLGNRPEQST